MIMRFPNYRQPDSRDCGPACLQIICKHYGKHIDIERIRQLMNTGRDGTSIYDFIEAASQLEIRCLPYSISYWKFRHEVPLPCVVFWRNNHYVVVYRITSKNVYVSDPALGLCRYSLKEFADGWLNSIEDSGTKRGICITCEPTIRYKDVIADKKNPEMLDALNYFWTYMKPYGRQMTQIVIILLIVTMISALFPVITQSVIDTGIPNQDYDFITLMLVSSIALSVGKILGTWLQRAIGLRFSARIKVSMTSDYLVRLFKMPMSFFENRIMGDIFERNADFDRIETNTLGSVFTAMLAVLNLLVFGSILFIYNKTIFAIYASGAVLYIVWVILFWSLRKKIDIRYYSLVAKNNSQWIEFLSRISDIKSYGYSERTRWQWEKNQVRLYDTRIRLLNLEQIQMSGSGLINAVKDAALIYLSSTLVINGDMTLGMLASVQYILGQLTNPLDSIVNFIISLQLSAISYSRVTDIQKLSAEDSAVTTGDELADFTSDLHLNNIYYRYGNDPFILKNLTATIPGGKITAVVGESGCGKSTLLKLLAGLYQPSNGHILLGNLRLASMSLGAWRKRCGIITQESSLFRDTICNNIIVGRAFDREKLLKAVTVADIRNDIEMLPKGYESMIGENGRGVSEGQKQRILLARALYDDPDYIFLDEMTSSLDINREDNILDSLKSQMPEKTIVIVSHRPVSISKADRIIVIKNGFISGYGTHETLMADNAEYCRLFKLHESLNNQ